MRVCFSNYLDVGGSPKEPVVHYRHPYRVNVDIYVQPAPESEGGWVLKFHAQTSETHSKYMKDALSREFLIYIRQRIKRDPHKLRFHEFVEMAKAVSVA